MRIGILTLPLENNYGGILQLYALQTVLERMGHKVVIIDEPMLKKKTKAWSVVKRVIKKCIGMPTVIFWEKYFYDNFPIISRNLRCFIDKYLHRVVVTSPSILEEKDFDAFVVGSDQIWRPIYYKHIENAFLAFAKDWKKVKRIAYAPSFGTDDWEYTPEQTKQCSSLLKLFDAVSVREESGIKLCKEHFGITPVHVLDPTMLLSYDDYNNLIESSKTDAPSGELLNYVLDKSERISKLISFISEEKKMKTFSASGKPFGVGVKVEECVQPSIEFWLRGFRDAEFVVTDSFHACVFSIIFNKPFCVIGNKGRGLARFNSLLKMFGQEFRMVEDIEGYKRNEKKIAKSPDIDLKNSDYRKVSIEFLARYL